MGLLYCNGFANVGSVADITNGLFSGSSVRTYNPTGGPFGGPSVTIGGSTTNHFMATFPQCPSGVTQTYGLSFWFKADLQSSTSSEFIAALGYGVSGNAVAQNTSTSYQLGLYLYRSSGTFGVSMWHSSLIFQGLAPTGILKHNTWHHIAVASYAHNSAGTLKFWLDGALMINLSGIDNISTITDITPVNSFLLGTPNPSTVRDFEVADIIIWDDYDHGRGPTDLTTFDGTPLTIETKFPTGSGSYSGWTSSSGGSNYTDVDETDLSSTDYVYGSSAGTADSYTFENLSTNVATILGVAVTASARRAGYVRTALDGICVSSASSAEASSPDVPERSTGGVYRSCQSFFGQDPATSTAWTTSGFDAAEFGFVLKATT